MGVVTVFVRVIKSFKYFVGHDRGIFALSGQCRVSRRGVVNMLRRPYRWSVYDEFEEMRQQMDQLMNWMSSPSPSSPLALVEEEHRPEIVPLFREGGLGGFQVDVTQDENEVIVAADMMPGIEKENISMELISPRALQITCERKEEREERKGEEGEAGRFYLHERKYGSISRVVPLPKAVNPEGAKASFRNGVLEVRLPVSSLELHRQIAIE
ncbi:Hsp20/alpha crystallin family protein [Methanogenium marinum]|uniref:Hsp20/alpha crystallin family protein n=1 Tax=Methanogenium marinum TaxID=348610 RepID=A0A9Q4KTL1_9EURY|nr:Hsp20/alpha crystallin family protein [Methanogenium marinum]MDE4907762.1 Hsp20/alpha crystallin family protein [Methanogenium marinum]